jgi:DNA-binding beta-propeller fold protein YncE
MMYVYNVINMDKCFSKFTIGSICIVATILMLIVTNSVYMSNAHAQTIGTKRIIEIQKTISNGENVTDVGNELTTSSRSIDNIGGIAIDKFSNIYLADSSNHTIQKFDSAGKFITKWGSTGSGDAQFNGTLDIATDVFSDVYVADSGNSRIQKFDSAGKFITKWGSTGSGDAQFNGTLDIATDPIANVYIFVGDNQSIHKFDSEGKFLGTFRF